MAELVSPLRSRWSYTTALLWRSCLVFALSDIFYGYDSAMFGSLQKLPSFENAFGTKIKGKYGFSTERTSIMNSVVWIGKLAGIAVFEPINERVGYRWCMALICGIQILSVIIELSAPNWQAYTSGRVLSYMASGMVAGCAPSYTSELAPVPLRSMFSGSLTFFLVLGQLWANLMSRAFAETESKTGWMVVTALQILPPLLILAMSPFIAESPRWYLAHGKREQALAVLDRLRPSMDVAAGHTLLEVEAIEQAIVESKLRDQGSWFDIFKGTYLRRSCIAMWITIFQQSSGGQFITSYGATFYVRMGLGSKAFTYQSINSACIMVVMAGVLLLYDKWGRRPIMIFGAACQIPLMCVVAGVGGLKAPTEAGINAVVACVILFGVVQRISTDSPVYIICSEIGGVKLRKKIMAWAIVWQVIAAFVVTYVTPYLLGSPGLNLGAKVGWIFVVISFGSLVFIVFYVPELKGRSLEETDELFEKRLWAWQFTSIETTGVGARIAVLEGGFQGHDVAQIDGKAPAQQGAEVPQHHDEKGDLDIVETA